MQYQTHLEAVKMGFRGEQRFVALFWSRQNSGGLDFWLNSDVDAVVNGVVVVWLWMWLEGKWKVCPSQVRK
jgi:hypothetical protein